MTKMLLSFVVSVVLLFSLTACAPETRLLVDSELITKENPAEIIPLYRIGVDDTLSINVWRNAELSVSVPVRPDGKISMPLIGDVHASGLSAEQVATNIQKRLAEYVRDPNVTIIITDLRSHEYLTRLRITGAVNNPSSINYRQGMTVLDAVLVAGSVNDFAAPNNTKLYRKIKGKVWVVNIDLGDILYEGELKTNIELRPGDIITVPERLF
ncbi:MAG: polysaccharide biosynthesis/export family protein [Methylococcales bacterium]